MSYFKTEDAKKAFNYLLESQAVNGNIQVAYLYGDQADKTLLTSIHESSDSSKSDRSEEGSDSEKNNIVNTNKNEELKTPPIANPTTYMNATISPVQVKPVQYSPVRTPLTRKDFNKTMYIEANNRSESSIDNDTISEGYV